MMKKFIISLKKDGGFTLVEILFAMGVFAISLMALIQVFYYAMIMNTTSKQITSSASIARKEMDSLRLLTMAELDAMTQVGTRNIDVNSDGTDDFIYS